MSDNTPRGFDRGAWGLFQGPCFLAGKMRTIVYVDGFNLYYGCLKGSRCIAARN